jgi:hypothetical protein
MKLLEKKSFNIVLLGAGANGSHFLRNLLQDLANYNGAFPTRILIADGDKVEGKNIKNQLFDHNDVNDYKVHALSERYGQHYNIDILAVNEYITSLEQIDSLFGENDYFPVLIGCLDNNRTRQLLHEYFSVKDTLLYIDVGVEGVILKEEMEKNALYSQLEKHQISKIIEGSGFSGQVVTGLKFKGHEVLAPVGTLYPNILTDEDSVFPTQACALTLNNPQRLETNKMAAQMVNIVMNNLFHTGELWQHEIQFNARYANTIVANISHEQENYFKEILLSK